MAGDTVTAPRSVSETKKESALQSWWQWLLVYPALAISMLSAVPQWMKAFEAYREDIAVDELKAAKKRNLFFKNNMDCLAAPFEWVENPDAVKVDGTICNSGDVMLRFRMPRFGGFIEPIIVNELVDAHVDDQLRETRYFPTLVSSAHAAAPAVGVLPGAAGTLLHRTQDTKKMALTVCQKFLKDKRTLLRHLKVGNKCYDERIDTYTGKINMEQEVQCRAKC